MRSTEALVAQHLLWRHASSRIQQRLVDNATTVIRATPGEVLVRQGDRTSLVPLLLSGIAIMQQWDCDAPKTVARSRLDPYGAYGLEMSAGEEAKADIRMVKLGRVLWIHQPYLDTALRGSTDLLLQYIRSRERLLSEMTTARSGKTARPKVARLLLWLDRYFRLPTRDARGALVAVKLSRKQIGGLIGLRDETVTRAFTEMKRQKLVIDVSAGFIITDDRGLRRYAGLAPAARRAV